MECFNFDKVIVFGGTTEGRLIADKLDKKGKLLCVCVATEYGETFLENTDTVRVGRLDTEEMKEMFSKENPTLVIDATHPYAIDVTKNIKDACNSTGFSYVRVSRDRENIDNKNFFCFEKLDEMITWLDLQEGVIFSTLGVKEVKNLTQISDYKNRVYVRVLPVESSLAMCDEAGIDRSHVIDAMGPFSYEQNVKMIKDISADILLTKDSGKAGGFLEKIQAAVDCGLKIAILIRPDEEKTSDVCSIEDILESIEKAE